jgi:glycosyltransferase involved in cell wall biosynthesis
MPKILMISTLPITLSCFLLPFATHCRQLGWQVDAMAQGISTDAACQQAFDRVWDVAWSRNPLELSNFFVTPRQIKALVVAEEYDIVHVHTPVAAFVTRYALKDLRKQKKVQVIYTAHGFHFHPQGKRWKNAIFVILEKIAGRWTDYLVTINREDPLAAARHQLLPATRIRHIPGIGIDLDDYHPQLVTATAVSQVRAELGITATTPLFLSVAEFTRRKHHQDLIQALAKLARPEVHLALAGAGQLLAEMQQLAKDLGIEHQVHFLGKRPDVPVLMRAAVATLLVSDQEGLARSVMESLALEVAVIGTKIRGIQELLEDDCGLLVEVGDVAQIAQAMAWTLAHPEQMQLMGKRGREKMAAYALPQIVKFHEDLYNEAVSSGLSRPFVQLAS